MAKQPELDDFRVPYFDDGKKRSKFSLSDFDPAAKPFSSGSKDTDRARLSEIGAQARHLAGVLARAAHASRIAGAAGHGHERQGRHDPRRVSRSRSARLAHRAVQGADARRTRARFSMARAFASACRRRTDDLQSQSLRRSAGAHRARQLWTRKRSSNAAATSASSKSCWRIAARPSSSACCTFRKTSSARVCRRASTIRASTGNSTSPISKRASSGTNIRRYISDALAATSTEYAPWYVIPGRLEDASQRDGRGVAVAHVRSA